MPVVIIALLGSRMLMAGKIEHILLISLPSGHEAVKQERWMARQDLALLLRSSAFSGSAHHFWRLELILGPSYSPPAEEKRVVFASALPDNPPINPNVQVPSAWAVVFL